MASEQQLQSKIILFLKKEKWIVVKTIVLSIAGFPDIFAFRNKVAIFIEVKSPTGKATPLQEHRIKQLTANGFWAEVIKDYNTFIKHYYERIRS